MNWVTAGVLRAPILISYPFFGSMNRWLRITRRDLVKWIALSELYLSLQFRRQFHPKFWVGFHEAGDVT